MHSCSTNDTTRVVDRVGVRGIKTYCKWKVRGVVVEMPGEITLWVLRQCARDIRYGDDGITVCVYMVCVSAAMLRMSYAYVRSV